jgi:hypothetical protein
LVIASEPVIAIKLITLAAETLIVPTELVVATELLVVAAELVILAAARVKFALRRRAAIELVLPPGAAALVRIGVPSRFAEAIGIIDGRAIAIAAIPGIARRRIVLTLALPLRRIAGRGAVPICRTGSRVVAVRLRFGLILCGFARCRLSGRFRRFDLGQGDRSAEQAHAEASVDGNPGAAS